MGYVHRIEAPAAETVDVDGEEALDVSIVVAVRNGAHQLPLLFAALEAQTLPRNRFEVLVVDDASSDSTPDVVDRSEIARLIRCGTRIGQPRARNVGIRQARAELIALTDADTVPDATWLERGVRVMTESDADVVGGGVSISLAADPSLASLVDAVTWLNQARCVDAGFAVGANIWARRSTFDRYGMFSEDIVFYHDDAEWGKRATRAGAHLIYAPDVHLTHPPRDRMKDVIRKAYHVGVGLAPHRRPPLRTFEGLPPLFLRPTPYLPPRRIHIERLRELGVEVGLMQRFRIHLSQWLFVRLPMLFGDIVGEVRHARAPQ